MPGTEPAPKTTARKVAPRNTQPKPPRTAAAPKPPAQPDYLTKQQIDWLLQGIEPYRVKHKAGQSNLQAYDVRNHLNEVFGFANWDGEVTAMELIFDVPKQLSSGKPGAYVCYRATYRLTIRALSGKHLATYTEVAAGDGQMPANMRFEAHDFAMKTAESQALKRAAINLGNQFGLSLYAKGTTGGITRGTFAYPEDVTLAPLTEQIQEETDPDASAEAAAAFEAAEGPQTHRPPETAQPPTPEPVTAQQAAAPPAQPQETMNDTAVITPNPNLDIAGFQEALGWLSNEARAELMARWKKTTLPPLARITTEEQLSQAWVLYDLVKPPAAVQPAADPVVENLQPYADAREQEQQNVDASWGLTQQRQAQVDQARRHFGLPANDTPPPYGDEAGWQDNNEFYDN